MKPLLSLRVIAIALLIGASFSSFGCRKKKDTVAKIYVIDGETNLPVQDATVRLWVDKDPEPGRFGDFEMIGTTNASGEATFMFNDVYQLGQAGVVVLDIEAKKGTELARGIIKVDEEKTSEETVFIQN